MLVQFDRNSIVESHTALEDGKQYQFFKVLLPEVEIVYTASEVSEYIKEFRKHE